MNTKAEDFSSELIETLYSWHGGQNSYVYSVASRGGDNVSVEDVRGALRELVRDYAMVKKSKSYTKAEKDELATAIDMLRYIADSREKGHEPI